MAATEIIKISPALQRFLDEGQDDDIQEEQNIPASLELGQLDFTTTETSLKGLEEEITQFADSDILRAILDQGCDPKEYERQYESSLREAERGSVQHYISESENLVSLHSQIETCDGILASMEEMLGRFQGDLGNISTEIRSLQEQSQNMSVKLKNRKAAEQKLGTFLDSLAITGPLIEGIVQREVDEDYQDLLLQLHKKLDFVNGSEAARETAAYIDVAPELERLRLKALSKVREFTMTRIFALRKPKTNIQILQQNVLLKHKMLIAFMRRHGPEVFAEVKAAYIDTLSKVLSSHFRAYLSAVERLEEVTASVTDVIGDPSGAIKGVMANLFTRAGGPGQQKKTAEVFAVGDRAAILHHLDQAAIIPHVAESENRKFPYEVLFRSVNKLLMDTSTSEYLFCIDFFQEDSIYHELIAPTLSVIEAALAAQLQETYDPVGLLLLIRINHSHQLIMNRRRVPCLDGYLDRINLMLWPRFKAILEAQWNSVKAINPSAFSENVQLHPVTAKYGVLTASLLILNSDFQDSQLEQDLERLRYAVMDLLTRLARQFKHKRNGVIFLINNYTYLVQVLRDTIAKASKMTPAPGATPPPQNAPLGSSGPDILKAFDDQLSHCTSMYVEETLQQQFGALIAFVKQAEAAQIATKTPLDQPIPHFGSREAQPIAKDFTAKWSPAIETLNRDVMRDFKSSSAGREVLRAAMTQLLLFYTRFLELLKRSGPEGTALIRDAVTVPSIMYEIKRYNRA